MLYFNIFANKKTVDLFQELHRSKSQEGSLLIFCAGLKFICRNVIKPIGNDAPLQPSDKDFGFSCYKA